MGIADLHSHTCHDGWGDGNQQVESILQYVEEHTDLDLFAITDHDSVDAAREAVTVHRRGGFRFGLIPGVEVTNQAGHMLCLFPGGDVVPVPSLRPFWWTVRYAQERGALCIPAHPVYPPWLHRTIRAGLERGLRLDAIEAINAGISQGAQTKLDTVIADLRGRVALVGNSDAHDQSVIASSYTRFPGHTIEDFVHALSNRTTEPVFIKRLNMPSEAKAFTTRRSMTRPGWVRNLWREVSHTDPGTVSRQPPS